MCFNLGHSELEYNVRHVYTADMVVEDTYDLGHGGRSMKWMVGCGGAVRDGHDALYVYHAPSTYTVLNECSQRNYGFSKDLPVMEQRLTQNGSVGRGHACIGREDPQ